MIQSIMNEYGGCVIIQKMIGANGMNDVITDDSIARVQLSVASLKARMLGDHKGLIGIRGQDPWWSLGPQIEMMPRTQGAQFSPQGVLHDWGS